jgi:hypothetical protein
MFGRRQFSRFSMSQDKCITRNTLFGHLHKNPLSSAVFTNLPNFIRRWVLTVDAIIGQGHEGITSDRRLESLERIRFVM